MPRPKPEPDEPCPWTEDELARIIERSCVFIMQAKERHGNKLGKIVGEYLLDDVYGGDEGYIRRNDPTKTRSLWDIAEGTGIAQPTLRNWVVWTIVRRKLEQAGIGHDLSMKHLLAIDALGDDVEAMAALVRWAQQNRVPAEELRQVVQDLVKDPGGKTTPRRKPRGKGRRKGPGTRPRPDDLIAPRLLGIVERAIEKAPPGPGARVKLRKAVREILALVGSKP